MNQLVLHWNVSVGRIVLLLCMLMMVLSAQTVRFTPDSSSAENIWRIGSRTELYIGASFYYMDQKDSIIVSCDTSESDITGELFVMVPGYADSVIRLFTNRDKGVRVNVTELIEKVVPVRTEIFFMYRFSTPRSDATPITLTRFTGLNRPGIDPEKKSSYPGANFVTRDFGVRPGFGHRWAVAGRVKNDGSVPTDTIVFGFEDDNYMVDPEHDSLMTADFDFNDVTFRVTGLRLNVEIVPDSLALTVPGSARAGDTIQCVAGVWADSAGVHFRSPGFDSLLHWELLGAGVNRDTLFRSGSSDSLSYFVGKTAGKSCRIKVWFVNPNSGDTVSITRSIAVQAGVPAALTIEITADTASTGFALNYTSRAGYVQLASNQVNRSVYALWRDRFGNFTTFSRTTKWDTLTVSSASEMVSGVVVVAKGDTLKGEGVIKKNSGNGTLLVTAADSINGIFSSDTLTVNVVGAAYDSLRLLVKTTGTDTISIKKLLISTDQCTSLIAQGRRTDNGIWQTIAVEWDFSFPWNAEDASVAKVVSHFCPADTGSGNLTIIHNAYVKERFPITVIPGVPASVVLYHKEAALKADTVLTAGTSFEFTARLFDKRGVWVSNVDLLTPETPLVWLTLESTMVIDTLDSTGTFRNQQFYRATYLPRKAHRSVKIVVRWEGVADTCKLSIKPGAPYRLVIESDANWKRKPNRSDPIDTIEIPDTRTSSVVFAILRDSLDNYVDSLRKGTWSSTDSIVSVNAGSPACKGTIVKNIAVISGLTRVIATDTGRYLVDTAWVRLLPYHFIDLRVTSSAGTTSIDSLYCTTNDDTTLYAKGLRSDTALWRDVDVQWSVTPSVLLSPAPPGNASRYNFFPQRASDGVLSISLKEDHLADSLKVHFVRGKPLWAAMQILTPASRIVAGDTIRAVVKIYNRPGLVEGEYCFSGTNSSNLVQYVDSLGSGGRKYKPLAFVDNRAIKIITPQNSSGSGTQCFHEGLDTIGLLLYYAPVASDSLHRIRFLAGDLNAATIGFRLRPGPISALSVIHDRGAGDSLTLQAQNDWVVLNAIGFDRFENALGAVPSKWTVSGSLHSIGDTGAVSRIRYTSEETIKNERGTIKATAKVDTTIADSIKIFIKKPLAAVVSAVTKDLNGNGLLDRIDILFSSPVSMSNAKEVARALSVRYNGTPLSVEKVTTGTKKNELRVLLKEPANPVAPQTGWTPTVSMSNRYDLIEDAVDTLFITASDGAGPVGSSC